MKVDAYDAAREVIGRLGFCPPVQTKITLFVCAAKNTNALFLASAEMQPFTTVAHQLLHTQYFHEVESVLLLTRITRWVVDPALYARALAITAPIWDGAWSRLPFPGAAVDSRAFYRGLALGHALLSGIRLTPVIPANAHETSPFAVALRRIERDDARMLQTQIQLLRAVSPELPLDEREGIIEERQRVVEGSFSAFLSWLCDTTAG